MSESITIIRQNVFGQCHALETIVIPDNVTALDFRAFNTCTNLKKVTLSKNLKTIGEQAFVWCKSITTITIPESVTSIGRMAFSGDGGEGGLETIYCKATTPPTLNMTYGRAFESTKTINVYVPANSVGAYITAWEAETLCNIVASTEY